MTTVTKLPPIILIINRGVNVLDEILISYDSRVIDNLSGFTVITPSARIIARIGSGAAGKAANHFAYAFKFFRVRLGTPEASPGIVESLRICGLWSDVSGYEKCYKSKDGFFHV